MPHLSQKRWAFLVGINEYLDHGNYRRLNYCVDDVCELSKVLEQIGYVPIYLHDRSNDWRQPRFPFRSNIISELKRICDAADENDLLLVYFACHGSREAPDQKPRLIAVDTHSNALATEGLSIPDDIEPLIMGSKAKQKILMLDACFIGQGRGVHNPAEFVRRVHELAKGYVVMAASTEDQESLESSGLKHSVFCHYVLRGLAGEAEMPGTNAVTVRDLQNFVLDGIREFSVRFSQDQEPQGRSEGNQGDIILADYAQYGYPKLDAEANPMPSLRAAPTAEVVQGRGRSPSQLIDCLCSLDYTRQSRTFEDYTPRSRRAVAFVIQAKDANIQHWLVKRLVNKLPDVKNAKVLPPIVVPAHPMWKTRDFGELWTDLGRELNCEAAPDLILDRLVAAYQTQTVILAMYSWPASTRSQKLQKQVLSELWEPLVAKVQALPNQPLRSRLMLFLTEGATMEQVCSDDWHVPIRLAPLTEITCDDVANWLEQDSVCDLLGKDQIQRIIEEEIDCWDSDPTLAIDQICYLFNLDEGIGAISSEWRLAG